MKYSLTLKNLELTKADQELIESKLRRLQKHLRPPGHAKIVLRGDTHHRQGQVINCAVSVVQLGKILHAERSRDSIQTALDEALEALKRELRKNRDKRSAKR